MKLILAFLSFIVLSSCAAHDVPPGEMERMRAQMPKEQNPPASYNSKGIGVP